MRTVLLTDVAIKASNNIVRRDIVAKSWYLKDRELDRIGAQKVCCGNGCGKVFTIGEAELHRYSHEKGKPKRVIELCEQSSEAFIDVNLALNPIDLSKYTLAEQAIIFGVSGVNMSMCPTCSKENAEYDLTGSCRNVGAEVQRGSVED
jgi:hypothetical protein